MATKGRVVAKREATLGLRDWDRRTAGPSATLGMTNRKGWWVRGERLLTEIFSSSIAAPQAHPNPLLFVIPPAPACRGSVAEGSAVRFTRNQSQIETPPSRLEPAVFYSGPSFGRVHPWRYPRE
jgi:hypothetical protein